MDVCNCRITDAYLTFLLSMTLMYSQEIFFFAFGLTNNKRMEEYPTVKHFIYVGLIHTSHFGTQYCDKKILRYLRHILMPN
jgi:hypothetical protein